MEFSHNSRSSGENSFARASICWGSQVRFRYGFVFGSLMAREIMPISRPSLEERPITVSCHGPELCQLSAGSSGRGGHISLCNAGANELRRPYAPMTKHISLPASRTKALQVGSHPDPLDISIPVSLGHLKQLDLCFGEVNILVLHRD